MNYYTCRPMSALHFCDTVTLDSQSKDSAVFIFKNLAGKTFTLKLPVGGYTITNESINFDFKLKGERLIFTAYTNDVSNLMKEPFDLMDKAFKSMDKQFKKVFNSKHMH